MKRTLANRADRNQAAIDECLRAAGAVVISMRGDPGIGFDMLVVHNGQVYLCEVKNGPAAKLTKLEEKRRAELALEFIELHIVRSEDDALRMIHR